MPIVQVKRAWDRQPQELIVLDWNNAAVRSLRPAFGFVGSRPEVDVVSGLPWSATSPSRSVGSQGIGYSSTAGSAFSHAGISSAAEQSCTIVAVFQSSGSGAYNFIARTSASGANNGFALGDSLGTSQAIGLHKAGVASLGQVSYSTGVPYCVVSCVNGATNTYYTVICNLLTKNISETSGSDSNTATAGNGSVAVVNINASPNQFSGLVFFVVGGFSALDIGLARIVARSPWQLFA